MNMWLKHVVTHNVRQVLIAMGNTHDTEIARIEADYIKTKYRSQGDYRWGYTGDRGIILRSY